MLPCLQTVGEVLVSTSGVVVLNLLFEILVSVQALLVPSVIPPRSSPLVPRAQLCPWGTIVLPPLLPMRSDKIVQTMQFAITRARAEKNQRSGGLKQNVVSSKHLFTGMAQPFFPTTTDSQTGVFLRS